MFAGLCCLFTFGVKRLSGAQRVESIELKSDALVIKSGKSKKKMSAITRGALRVGIGGTEWAQPFLDAYTSMAFREKTS